MPGMSELERRSSRGVRPMVMRDRGLSLADELRVRRERLGLSQLQLADRLGVRQQTVSRWESNTAVPRPSRIVQLARILGADEGHLLRLGQFLPAAERPAIDGLIGTLLEQLPSLPDGMLVDLIDVLWREYRARGSATPTQRDRLVAEEA
jgi:transcriptional regulator with XRE-family HTH domain